MLKFEYRKCNSFESITGPFHQQQKTYLDLLILKSISHKCKEIGVSSKAVWRWKFNRLLCLIACSPINKHTGDKKGATLSSFSSTSDCKQTSLFTVGERGEETAFYSHRPPFVGPAFKRICSSHQDIVSVFFAAFLPFASKLISSCYSVLYLTLTFDLHEGKEGPEVPDITTRISYIS